ncbi:MAG: hypothetical protein COA88_03135 [Kordia sp.]|nr:MAG: hypothetical protein COA88_03135 [Kordia sp.]
MKKRLFLLLEITINSHSLFAQVGINTTSPKSRLDIVASNQASPSNKDGILIPRIDSFPVINPTVDQNAMLVFLNTVSGGKQPGYYYWNHDIIDWIGIAEKDTTKHYIGELWGGGIVFYVYDNGQHGLIASLDDVDGGNGVNFSGDTINLIGPTAQSVHNGASNTVAITNQDATLNKAATLCDTYVGGGFTDWYLPARWELREMYNAGYVISKKMDEDGDFTTNPFHLENIPPTYSGYWSSMEYSNDYVFYIRFNSGRVYKQNKMYALSVRAVRSF